MSSAGNDIVALRPGDKRRTHQSAFYSKILSVSEQTLYRETQFAELPFEYYVWLLWSVKESVYKYLKRTIPGLLFSPTRITVQHIEIPPGHLIRKSECIQWESTGEGGEFHSGTVKYGTHIFYFRSKINEDWITTVVNDDENFHNVYWGIQSIDDSDYSHQSKAARALLLNKLSSFFAGDLQVGKSPVGYPVILKGTENLPIPVSLAHDDHFVAYSFKINSPDNN